MANSLTHQEYGRTRVEWLSNLNTEYTPPKNFRRTSIICTIGMHDTRRQRTQCACGAVLMLCRSEDQLA